MLPSELKATTTIPKDADVAHASKTDRSRVLTTLRSTGPSVTLLSPLCRSSSSSDITCCGNNTASHHHHHQSRIEKNAGESVNWLISDVLCSYPDQTILSGLAKIFQRLCVPETGELVTANVGGVLRQLYVRDEPNSVPDSSCDASDLNECIENETIMPKAKRDAKDFIKRHSKALNTPDASEPGKGDEEAGLTDGHRSTRKGSDAADFMSEYVRVLNCPSSTEKIIVSKNTQCDNNLNERDFIKNYKQALNTPDALEKATESFDNTLIKRNSSEKRVHESDVSIDSILSSEQSIKSNMLNVAKRLSLNNAKKRQSSDLKELAHDIWAVILEGVLDEIRSRSDVHLSLDANPCTDRRRSDCVTSKQIDRVVSEVLSILKSKSAVDLKKLSKVVLDKRPNNNTKSTVSVRNDGKIEINHRLLSEIISDAVNRTLSKRKIEPKPIVGDAASEWIEDRLAAIISNMVMDRISSRKELKRTDKSTELCTTRSKEHDMIAQITDKVVSRIVPKSKPNLTANTFVSAQKVSKLSSSLPEDNAMSVVSIFYKGDLLADSNTLTTCIDQQLDKQSAKQFNAEARAVGLGRCQSAGDAANKPFAPSLESARKLLPTSDPELHHLPLYNAREIRTPSRRPRLVRQDYTVACVNSFDDGSQTYEILAPNREQDAEIDIFAAASKRIFKKPSSKRGRSGVGPMGDCRKLDAVFAVLPDGTTVCFEQI